MDKSEYMAAGMSDADAEIAAGNDRTATNNDGANAVSFEGATAEAEYVERSQTDEPSVSASSEEIAMLRERVHALGVYVQRILQHLDPSGLSRTLHPVSKLDGEPL